MLDSPNEWLKADSCMQPHVSVFVLQVTEDREDQRIWFRRPANRYDGRIQAEQIEGKSVQLQYTFTDSW